MTSAAAASIADNLARVRESIATAAARAGRDPAAITLVGISKTQPAEVLAAAIQAGLRELGENRVQEAADKFPLVRELVVSPPVFHMVGHLQSNKAGAAVDLFDCVDSVDSVKLAQALSRRVPAGSELPILVEVYVGDDAARPGVRPEAVDDVVGAILELPRLRVDGLMTIAPLGSDAGAAFARVRRIRDSVSTSFPAVHFGVLSMGMSEDYAEAIAEGSTHIRIGTALFGPRRPRL